MWLLLALLAPLVVGGILGILIRKHCKTTGQKLLATGALIVVVVGAAGLGAFLMLSSAASKSSAMMEIDDQRWLSGDMVVSADFREAVPFRGPCPKPSSSDFDREVRSKQCSVIIVCGNPNVHSDQYLFIGWNVSRRQRQAGSDLFSAVKDIDERTRYAANDLGRTLIAHTTDGSCFDPVAYFHGSGSDLGGGSQPATSEAVLAPVSQVLKQFPPEFTVLDGQGDVKVKVEGRAVEEYGNRDISNLPNHDTITCSKKDMICHRTVTTPPMKTGDMTGIVVNGADLLAVPIQVDASTLKALESPVTSNYQIASWSDLRSGGYQIQTAREPVGCGTATLTINSFEHTVADSTVQSCDKNIPSEYKGFMLDGNYNMVSEAKQQRLGEHQAISSQPTNTPSTQQTDHDVAVGGGKHSLSIEAIEHAALKTFREGGDIDTVTHRFDDIGLTAKGCKQRPNADDYRDCEFVSKDNESVSVAFYRGQAQRLELIFPAERLDEFVGLVSSAYGQPRLSDNDTDNKDLTTYDWGTLQDGIAAGKVVDGIHGWASFIRST
jgi:hypothetical protein